MCLRRYGYSARDGPGGPCLKPRSLLSSSLLLRRSQGLTLSLSVITSRKFNCCRSIWVVHLLAINYLLAPHLRHRAVSGPGSLSVFHAPANLDNTSRNTNRPTLSVQRQAISHRSDVIPSVSDVCVHQPRATMPTMPATQCFFSVRIFASPFNQRQHTLPFGVSHHCRR